MNEEESVGSHIKSKDYLISKLQTEVSMLQRQIAMLREENRRLRIENQRLMNRLNSMICPNCGTPCV